MIYYVETFSDITRDYENRDAQLRMFRVIMIIVMIVCLMLMAILNNMIVVPIRRLSRATKLVAGGRAGIRIRKRSKDEIGVLAEDFNRMSTSLNRTMKELEEKTKSQEMFTNNFAHELKTPLTSMIGYADLIRSNQLSEEEADYLCQPDCCGGQALRENVHETDGSDRAKKTGFSVL